MNFGLTKPAYTKEGNPYTKSRIATTIGVTTCAGISATKIAKETKLLKTFSGKKNTMIVLKQMYDFAVEAMPEFAKQKSFKDFAKSSFKNAKYAYIASTALAIGVGFGIGKLIDNYTNKKNAKKADKMA